MNVSHHRDVVVECWTSRAAHHDVFHVAHQVFFGHRSEEEVWHDHNGIDFEFLAVFGHLVAAWQVHAADVDEHLHVVFATAFEPFFGQKHAFLASQSHTFAGHAVEHDSVHAFGFQEVAVLVDHVIVDGACSDFKIGREEKCSVKYQSKRNNE